MSHQNEKAWSAERVLVHLPAIVLLAVAVPVPFDLGLLVLGCAAILYRVGVQRARRSIGLLDGLVILFGLSYLTASAFGSDLGVELVGTVHHRETEVDHLAAAGLAHVAPGAQVVAPDDGLHAPDGTGGIDGPCH